MGTHREGDWSVRGGGKQPEKCEKSEQSVKKREGGDSLQGLRNGAEHQKIERQQKKKSPVDENKKELRRKGKVQG